MHGEINARDGIHLLNFLKKGHEAAVRLFCRVVNNGLSLFGYHPRKMTWFFLKFDSLEVVYRSIASPL
jgi:hypothetical protein